MATALACVAGLLVAPTAHALPDAASSIEAPPTAEVEAPDEAPAEDEAPPAEVEADAAASTCRAATTDCFRFTSVSGKQLRVTDKYFPGRGRYVRDRGDANGARAQDWRIKQLQQPRADADGNILNRPGRFRLWTWFETDRCLDSRDLSDDVVMWPCSAREGKIRQWWYFQLAPDRLMPGGQPSFDKEGREMRFMIRNEGRSDYCLTAGNPAVLLPCGTAGRVNDQLFTVSDVRLSRQIKQAAVDYQQVACLENHSCETAILLDQPGGVAPEPMLAFGCASVAQGAKTDEVVKNDTSQPVEYTFVRRVSTSVTHRWDLGVRMTYNAGNITEAILKFSAEISASYGGQWNRSDEEQSTVSRSIAPRTYAWETRGVPQVPTTMELVYNKSEGLDWTVRGPGWFAVNGTDRVKPILVFNEAPSSHVPAPNCQTLGAPRIVGEGPQILRDGRNLGQNPPRVGETLSAAPGEWDLGGVEGFEYRYQWLAAGQLIPGATGADYTVTANDVGSTLSVRVSTKRANYIDGHATSAATLPVVTAPDPGTVTIEPAQPRVGDVLTATASRWPDDAELAYQWRRDGEPVADATSREYTATDADAGRSIAVTVTATMPGSRTASATSNPVVPVPRVERVELALKVAVSSAPYTPEDPPFFTVQALADGQPVAVPGTVRALRDGAELVAVPAVVREGRTLATVRLPQGVLPAGEQTIELVFEPDDAEHFAPATHTRTVRIQSTAS